MPYIDQRQYAGRRDYFRRYREANREIVRSRSQRTRHGSDIDEWYALTWHAQDGRCYLCGDPLTTANRGTHIDHDHDHCPVKTSCPVCRRGLACDSCNKIIGLARNDPDRLRLIAENFEPVLLATRIRMAAAPRQEAFDGNP